jgi:hypothetical protein
MTPTKLLAKGLTDSRAGKMAPELCRPNTVRVPLNVVCSVENGEGLEKLSAKLPILVCNHAPKIHWMQPLCPHDRLLRMQGNLSKVGSTLSEGIARINVRQHRGPRTYGDAPIPGPRLL